MSKKTLIRMISENKGGNRPSRYAVIAGKLTAAEMCSMAWSAKAENADIAAIIKGNRPLDGVAAVYVASAIAAELGADWKCSLDSLLCGSCAASYAAYNNAKRAAATAKRNLDEAVAAAGTAYKATNPVPSDTNKAWANDLWQATHTPEIEAMRKAAVDASAALDREKEEYNKACLSVDSGYRSALALRRDADKPDE